MVTKRIRHLVFFLGYFCTLLAALLLLIFPQKTLFRFSSLGFFPFAGKDTFISGEGTRNIPFVLHSQPANSKTAFEKRPTVISISDDPEGFFQDSPPSPIDHAVILKNIERVGIRSAAIALPLSWEDPDPIALVALEQSLGSIRRVITSAALTRVAAPLPIPSSFRRASLPIAKVMGDVSQIPSVNHPTLPDMILGSKSSLSGFTILENQPFSPDSPPQLIARWGERIVFSLPLLFAIDHLQVDLPSIKIVSASHIALTNDGPYIPIDRYGRLAFKVSKVPAPKILSAATLIDAAPDLFIEKTLNPILIRDDLSGSEPSSEGLLQDPRGYDHNFNQHRRKQPWNNLQAASYLG